MSQQFETIELTATRKSSQRNRALGRMRQGDYRPEKMGLRLLGSVYRPRIKSMSAEIPSSFREIEFPMRSRQVLRIAFYCRRVDPQISLLTNNLKQLYDIVVKLSPQVRAFLAAIGERGGKVGGKSRSKAKANASRKNGKLGGRPRKTKKGGQR